MIVLGIDPGLSVTGYACLEARGGDPSAMPGLVEAGVLRFRGRQAVAPRLAELQRDLEALLERLGPACVCVESLFSHYAHPRTAIIMGHARGVILATAAARGLLLVELPPAEVKKSVTGNGRATKPQVQQAVMARLGLAAVPEPHDVADAIAVAICGALRASSPATLHAAAP